MELAQYLELQYNDSSNPCYFSDVETDEIIFMNLAMQKKFQVFEEYRGKKCYEIVHNATSPCSFCAKKQAKPLKFTETRIYSNTLKAYQRSNSTIIQAGQRKLLMTKYFLSAVDEQRADAKHSFENAMTRCIEILSMPDQNTSIQTFLKLLGEFYSCQLAYIYEFDRTNNTLASKYFWRSNNNLEEIVELKDMSIDAFLNWLENDENHEILNIDSQLHKYDKNSLEHSILQQYNITNITLSKLWNKDGSLMGIVGLSNRAKPMYDSRLLKAISHFVVERFNEKSLVKVLENLSEVDLLTGFYNRAKYSEAIVQLQKNYPKKMGVLFINLNGLRKTNEYFGFEMGDIQIKKTATTLKKYFEGDFYRVSGDEFVGFIPNCDKEEFEKNVNKLQLKLKEKNHETTFSVGHSWGNGSYKITELVKFADNVMLINKQAFYFHALKDNTITTNAILQDLFRAIAEEEFLVYLQPQINLKTEEVVGAEALIRRYDKKEGKMISPAEFIPLYEGSAIIRHVDLFVVRKVCQMLVNWEHHKKTIPIAVNLSRVTLLEHGIVKTISNICDEYGVAHELIMIEVTERIGLTENDITSRLIDEFKKEGFRLSLDDFGCAYSNIVTLAKISVDEVKIDKSLVDDLMDNERNRIIVDSMMNMCNKFENTHTLAEGIELEEQAEFLRSVNCLLGQGYLYSCPIPSEDFFDKYIK